MISCKSQEKRKCKIISTSTQNIYSHLFHAQFRKHVFFALSLIVREARPIKTTFIYILQLESYQTIYRISIKAERALEQLTGSHDFMFPWALLRRLQLGSGLSPAALASRFTKRVVNCGVQMSNLEHSARVHCRLTQSEVI